MENLTIVQCKNWEVVSQRDSRHICKHMRSIIYASVNGLIKTAANQTPSRLETKEENRIPKQQSSFNGDEYTW